MKLFTLIILNFLLVSLSAQSNYPCSSPDNGGVFFTNANAAISSLSSPSLCSNYSSISGLTITDCYLVTSSTNGTIGVVQLFTNSGPNSCDNNIANSRTAIASFQGCGNTQISPNVVNAGNSSTFNPEWNNLCPNTEYMICITTIIPSGCPYTRGCPAFYNAPGGSPSDLTLSISSTQTCVGSCIGVATAIVTGGDTPYNYDWSSGGNMHEENALCENSYTLEVTDNNGCKISETVVISAQESINDTIYNTTCILADTGTVIVNNFTSLGCDSITTTITNSFASSINTNTTTSDATITAAATGVSYQWIDCNNANSDITGEINQAFTATTNGTYAVVITANGCSKTSDCVLITGVNIKEFEISKLIVYPNPTSKSFTFTIEDNGAIDLEIKNIIGQKVYRNTFANAKGVKTINTSNYKTGIYFLNFKQNNKYKTIRLVIK